MYGHAMHGSLRIIIVVTIAVIAAAASFANSFAMTIGIAAATGAAAILVVVVFGAFVSLVREKPRTPNLNSSNRPDDID